MLILASDTSGPSVSVALWLNGRLLGEMTQNVGLTHSVTYLPLIESLMEHCSRRMDEIDLYAVTVGPGSFTGIRIGISAVKAMAYAAKKPVFGVSTLEAMAWPYRSSPDVLVCPMLDARNGRVYAGTWQEGILVLQEENQLMTDFLAKAIRQAGSGSDPESGRSAAATILTLGCPIPDTVRLSLPDFPISRAAPVSSWLPHASAVAEMAAIASDRGLLMDPQQLQARYLSASAAERQKNQTHG